MVFFRSKSKGVTLVELSIVLAIFGILIVVGISGRSLIDISRATATTQYLNNRSIAFQTFTSTYDCVPGDCATLSVVGATGQLATVGVGNGNTMINAADATNPNEIAFAEEHLVRAQLFNRSIGIITDGINQAAGSNLLSTILPLTKVPTTYVSAFTIAGEHYNILGAASATENVINGTPVAYPNLFRIIDSKVDDGNAITGLARCEEVAITGATVAFANTTTAYNAMPSCVFASKL